MSVKDDFNFVHGNNTLGYASKATNKGFDVQMLSTVTNALPTIVDNIELPPKQSKEHFRKIIYEVRAGQT